MGLLGQLGIEPEICAFTFFTHLPSSLFTHVLLMFVDENVKALISGSIPSWPTNPICRMIYRSRAFQRAIARLTVRRSGDVRAERG